MNSEIEGSVAVSSAFSKMPRSFSLIFFEDDTISDLTDHFYWNHIFLASKEGIWINANTRVSILSFRFDSRFIVN